MEKHAAAYILKKNGASNLEISQILQVNHNTISVWTKKFGWEDKLIDEQLFQETSLEQVRSLISFNLKVLNAIKDKKAKGVDFEKAEIEDLEKMLTDKGQVDALNKLFVNIRGKEITWEQIVKTVREFLEYLEAENFKLAQQATPYVHAFVDTKRKTN